MKEEGPAVEGLDGSRKAQKCDPDVIGPELSGPCHGGTAACPAYFFALPFWALSHSRLQGRTHALQPSDHDVHLDLISASPR